MTQFLMIEITNYFLTFSSRSILEISMASQYWWNKTALCDKYLWNLWCQCNSIFCEKCYLIFVVPMIFHLFQIDLFVFLDDTIIGCIWEFSLEYLGYECCSIISGENFHLFDANILISSNGNPIPYLHFQRNEISSLKMYLNILTNLNRTHCW